MVTLDANRRKPSLCSTSMRILHVPHAYSPAVGGAETLVRRVGIELATRGHDVMVITSDLISAEGFFEPGVAPIGRSEEIDDGVLVKRIPLFPRVPRRRHREWAEARFRKGLRSLTRDHAFDVVMALPHLLPNVVAATDFARGRNIPMVVTPLLHENDPHWPTEALREVLGGVDAVIALTRYEADRLVTGYGVSRDRVFVSGLGVDRFQTPPAYRPDPMILFLGRLSPSKNIPLLLEAFDRVASHLPEAKLVIAGSRVPGVEPVDAMIERTSRTHRDRIKVLVDIDDRTKAGLLASARCLVSPSINESFGLVLLEAMAAGTPVIAIETSINREIVNADSGILVANEPEALSTAMGSLVRDDQMAASLGAAANRRVSASYSWSNVSDVYDAAYAYAQKNHHRSEPR